MQLAKYLLVGCINTLTGLLCIFVLIKIGTAIYVANLAGYLLGFIVSYLLNTKFTFHKKYDKFTLTKFIISQIAAYLINLIAIYIFLQIYPMQIYTSQIIGMLFFTFPAFLINKFWALK